MAGGGDAPGPKLPVEWLSRERFSSHDVNAMAVLDGQTVPPCSIVYPVVLSEIGLQRKTIVSHECYVGPLGALLCRPSKRIMT